MTIELELTPELEAWLRREAERFGTDAEEVAISAINRQRNLDTQSLLDDAPDDELVLLERLKSDLDDPIRFRCQELSARSETDDLTDQETKELVRLVNDVEAKNASRLANMIKLAELRKVSFEEISLEHQAN